jgi:hypothetical protein
MTEKDPRNSQSDDVRKLRASDTGSRPGFDQSQIARKLQALDQKVLESQSRAQLTPLPVARPGAPSPSGTGREERLACSFPGLMKVLIPEKSFVPTPVAVRVTNLSPGGALVEIHDRAQLEQDLALPNRFFELKVAHPEIPMLRGTVAWCDMSRQNPLVGLTSFFRHPELAQVVLTTESGLNVDGPPPLPAPILDPFPPTAHEETITISGTAPEAIEVQVKRNNVRFEAKVVRNRFEIKLEMEPNIENHFTLRSYAGERRSKPVPIRVKCEKPNDERRLRFHATSGLEKNGTHTVRLEFAGSVRQAELILYRYSQLIALSEKVSFTTTLEAPTPFDRRLFEALRSEGALLASGDTGRNEAASKLLEELL